MSKKVKKYIGIAVFLGFIALSLFGLLALGMDHNAHNAPGCPTPLSGFSICTMTTLEHINAWQNSLTALSYKVVGIISIFLLASIFLYKYQNIFEHKLRKRIRLRVSNNSKIPVFLNILFARGILNPKTY